MSSHDPPTGHLYQSGKRKENIEQEEITYTTELSAMLAWQPFIFYTSHDDDDDDEKWANRYIYELHSSVHHIQSACHTKNSQGKSESTQ